MEIEDLVVLCRVSNLMQFDAIKEVLEHNGIHYTFRHRGLSIGRAYELPFLSESGIEILVLSNEYENAQQKIQPILDTLT